MPEYVEICMSVPNQVCLSHFCFTFPCCNLFFTLTGGYLFQHLQKARSYSVKLYNFYRFLLIFLTGFTSLIVLLLFPLSITFFDFVHGF